MPKISLTGWIMIAMVAGVLLGLWVYYNGNPALISGYSAVINVVTDVFFRLIKMIIAPLVFTTLVVGAAHMGDTKAVGRIGGNATLRFVSASLVSLLLGLIMVNILRPGDNLNLPLPDASASTNLNAASLC